MPIAVHITRSPRRQRTMSARLVGGRLEVRVPEAVSDTEAHRFAEVALRRLEQRAEKHALDQTGNLLERAQALSRRYFDGKLVPASVEYSADQNRRFGSCSVRSRRLRLSTRLAKMPAWVQEYVLVHELAHLQHPNHSPAFWRLVSRYPLAERARGYLMASGLDSAEGGGDEIDA